MGKLKFSDWLMIAKYKAGLITLSFADQNRFGIYLEYSHEDLMTIRDYADAYVNVNYEEPEAEAVVIETEPVTANEKPEKEDIVIQDNWTAAITALSNSEFKIYMYHLAGMHIGKSQNQIKQELGCHINTYKSALVSIEDKGFKI